MGTSENMLSQNNIDVLSVIRDEGQDEEPIEDNSPPGAPRVVALSSISRRATSGPVLEERFRALEKSVERLAVLEKAVGDTSAVVGQLQQGLLALVEQLKAVYADVEVVHGNAQSTPGYGLKKTFTCKSCNTSGYVAVRIRCTKCGHESWRGWSPPQK